jgi:hypothetical protein
MLRDALNRAHAIQAQIDALYEELDAVLAPVCANASTMSYEDLAALINELPRGFHRSELRVILNNMD